jgi:colanic acid biosynthesis glycosyl transferase WcaI
MRVCIVNEFFYPDNTGGTGTVLSDLARRVTDEYGDVTIDVITSTNLYRKSIDKLPLLEDWDGITIYRVPARHPNGLSLVVRTIANLAFSIKALLKLLKLQKYDLLLIGTAPPMVAFAADIYKKLTRTPFVYIVYDLEPDRSVTMKVLKSRHPAARALKVFQNIWLHSASRIVVLGRCMQQYVSNAYSLPLSKIDVIPIGANSHEVLPGEKNSRFRKANGITGFALLYSGNFGRYHNFDTVLDAAKVLMASNPDINIVLVGDGVQKAHITQRVADENISSVRVFDFVGTKDYSDLLASADVSLVTLEPGMEGLCVPSKFYSILASGRAVIAVLAKTSEVALVIEESHCGIQVNQGDSGALVAAIQRLASNTKEAEQMGVNARKVLEGRYATDLIAAQYYQSFLAACNISASVTTHVTSGVDNVVESGCSPTAG